MSLENPFHEGELIVQQRANESAVARRNSAVISDAIPKAAMPFVGQQSFVVIASLDPQGNPWASILVGAPGFIEAFDERTVLVHTHQFPSSEHDPLWANIENGADVGMIVIDLGTRRRLRINGYIQRLESTCLKLSVARAYANCPKYIQKRQLSLQDEAMADRVATVRQGRALEDHQQAFIAAADTFFVASVSPGHGLDASHRGGNPGFIRMLDRQRIRIPDYGGNSLFNTLGNLTVYPRAGLVFLDFETGRILQLIGEAEILWDQDDPHSQTGGTGRYWELKVTQWVETQLTLGLQWESPDYSPYNPFSLTSKIKQPAGMKLAVTRVVRKTQRIKAFQLSAVDGADLPAVKAGSHIPLLVRLPDGTQAYRQYSILSDPADRSRYEVAVLLEPEGQGGSRFMHEGIRENQLIEAGEPRNDFPLSSAGGRSILIAGGIGITPILSMLKTLAAGESSVEVHYAARSVEDFAYRDEIELLSAGRASFYPSEGRDAARLNLDKLLCKQDGDTHIYVCGPARMIESVRSLADKYGWNPDQIHVESFGSHVTAEDKAITVRLARTNKAISVEASQTILDALSDAGVSVPYDCKRGECRMCVTDVINGQPHHRDLCLSGAERERSMCLCVSRAKGNYLVLDL